MRLNEILGTERNELKVELEQIKESVVDVTSRMNRAKNLKNSKAFCDVISKRLRLLLNFILRMPLASERDNIHIIYFDSF